MNVNWGQKWRPLNDESPLVNETNEKCASLETGALDIVHSHRAFGVSDDKVLFYVVTGAFRLEGYEGGERRKAAVGIYDWRKSVLKAQLEL